MASRKSTKLRIPHSQEDCELVGILEQLAPKESTQGRKIALILHGAMGHKDYLFQKRLALRFPMDSFRFDFRGYHESGGQRTQGGLMKDAEDLVTVVSYLRNTYGYEIDLVVGHSRGSVVGMYWLCTSEEGQRVCAMVNVSGRYRMHRVYDVAEAYKEEWDAKGYYERTVTVARQTIVERIYPHNIEEISEWNTAIVWDKFPDQIHVLTMHGLVDKAVPAYDAVIYSRALGARTPGTHNLHLIEEADHNFTNRQDEVVDCILEWWDALNQGRLKTGILLTGVRGKL
ncbi:ectomycorrhiza-regulated esterase [Suillus subalutaceus]|uniref:ectomycorrhiza-regulated esterase n=1 Tax=Suillus subalutaceus TaxID=48586 RepID=UPI001B8744B9|nr:ectomycorrhiza-regulated esterase [Suillus subalutaceus]KAG1851575.1 ectomycorrhiza-regulated esterase [Suillus subalutaceus]